MPQPVIVRVVFSAQWSLVRGHSSSALLTYWTLIKPVVISWIEEIELQLLSQRWWHMYSYQLLQAEQFHCNHYMCLSIFVYFPLAERVPVTTWLASALLHAVGAHSWTGHWTLDTIAAVGDCLSPDCQLSENCLYEWPLVYLYLQLAVREMWGMYQLACPIYVSLSLCHVSDCDMSYVDLSHIYFSHVTYWSVTCWSACLRSQKELEPYSCIA